jgi:hypothetical protein
MTIGLFASVLRFFSKSTFIFCAAATLFYPGILFLPAHAQVGLPSIAISVPENVTVAADIESAKQCSGKSNLIVLQTIPFQLASARSAKTITDEQRQALQSLPSDIAIWLDIAIGNETLTGNETEKQLSDQVDTFLELLPLASPAVHGLILEVNEPKIVAGQSVVTDQYLFELLRLAVAAKSRNAGLRLAIDFPPGFIEHHGEIVRRLATYTDLLSIHYSSDWQKDAAWIAAQAFNKPLMLKLDADASSNENTTLEADLAASGSSVETLWTQPKDIQATAATCSLVSYLNRAIPGSMLRVNAQALPFQLSVDDKQIDQAWWFGSGQSSDLVLVAHVNASREHSKALSIRTNSAAKYDVQVSDPVTGAQLPAVLPADSKNGFEQTLNPSSEYLLITLHKKVETDTTVYNTVAVKGGVDLSVDEIIARWQQYREAQKQRLNNYLASSFMNLHFQSTNVTSSFDISMRLKQFFDRSGLLEVQQVELLVNGVKFNNKYSFPLPQIEPEKVLTQPLELKLNEQYAYRLLGTEQVNGALCFVVGIEPKIEDAHLYSGKIWIDGTTFREVRQTLSQRGDKSNIVVNVETQNFELVPDGKGNSFNLLRSINAQQTLNAAGRDFLLQRAVDFSRYEINTPQFSSALTAAHNSNDPMFRDTAEGLRTLKKQGNERVLVQNTQKRITSLVGGAMYEGTFNFPIPIAGISISDFDFRHTGAQLSTFFAGPILANNLSKQYGKKYRLSTDLALSALPGEDRIYSGNVEDTGAEIWSWAESIGGRATWQAKNYLSLTASTYLEHDFYHGTSDTSSQYVVPRSGVQLIPGLQIRFSGKGYVFTLDGSRGQRFQWRQFGCAASLQQPNGCDVQKPAESAYTLYDADLNKDYFLTKFTKAGWDLSYYGGNQLDRFSRYFPSFFSQPNLHGIPSGTDSFDAIAMGNVHYGFNVMDAIKFEGLYSYARARNQDESSHYRLFDGLETHVNTAGPFGTLMQSNVSYALDGNIPRYNSRWGVVLMIFKPLH